MAATDLTPADLANLRRLLAAATPGPWRINERRPTKKGWWLSARGWQMFAEVYGNYDKEFNEQGHANAALIAALVNAAPALIEMAERWLKNKALMGHLSDYLGRNGDDD